MNVGITEAVVLTGTFGSASSSILRHNRFISLFNQVKFLFLLLLSPIHFQVKIDGACAASNAGGTNAHILHLGQSVISRWVSGLLSTS